jgi:plasmid replication initiation protein
MNDIVKKSFYLTSLFADIKSEHNWTTNEIKVVMLIFSQMSKYRIYIKNKDGTYINKNDLKIALKEVPIKYTITKSEFISITGVRTDNISREINKVRKNLISKIIHTSHPLELDNESGESISWFSKITYSNVKGELDVEFNKYALERLIAFVKYSKISFENLVKLKSSYAIFTYLFIKIIKDISYDKTINSEILDISEFKEKLFLKGKYKDINLFRTRVLDVIKKEIDDHTDLTFQYKLMKGNSGKALKLIKMTFDPNPKYIETQQKVSLEPKRIDLCNIGNDAQCESLFESTLVGWGIRAKRVGELEEEYSLDVIQSAIDLTLKKEKNKEIKTTKAAIFLGILENQQIVSDEMIDREQQEIAELEEKEFLKNLGAEYDAIQKVINDNADEISNYLSAKSINATYKLNSDLNEQLLNMSCVDAQKFKEFRPKLPVIHNGYYNMKIKKQSSPNMYNFLLLMA